MTTYDNVLANPVDGHAGQAVELAFSVAIVTEFFQKVAGRVEHLNSVIGTVCHLRCTIELCNKKFRLKLSSLSLMYVRRSSCRGRRRRHGAT